MHHRTSRWTELIVATLCGLTAAGALGCQRAVSPFAQRPPSTVPSRSPVAAAASGGVKPAVPPGAGGRDVAADVSALAAKIGVAPGPLRYGPDVGSAAVLRARSGSVAVRRTGEQLFADVGIETRLHPGDQIITGNAARAMLVVADQTVIELLDNSAVVVGNPAAGPAPAASAGVLSGVARFSVSPRAPGEGPFLIFAGAGVVAVPGNTGGPAGGNDPGGGNTHGSSGPTFAVGVAAPGLARVGVESGTVEVAGPAALKKPVSIAAGEAVTLDGRAGLGRPIPFPDDDWASWRTATERRVPPEVWARDQPQRLPVLQSDIDQCSGELVKLAARALELGAEASSEDTTSRSAQRRYKQAAPEYAAAVEATFRLSIDLQRLIAALLSETHALERQQLARQPQELHATHAAVAPLVVGATLYNKKYQTIVDTTLAPVRPLYFLHHPTGRRQAHAVGFDVPAFLAEMPLTPLPPNLVDALLKRDTYAPPTTDHLVGGAATRTIALGAPKADWDTGLVVTPAPARENSWYASASGAAPRPPAEAEAKFRATAHSRTPSDLKSAR